MLIYLSGNLSVRMMLARVVQLGGTYVGPRFEFVVSCEYITVRTWGSDQSSSRTAGLSCCSIRLLFGWHCIYCMPSCSIGVFLHAAILCEVFCLW